MFKAVTTMKVLQLLGICCLIPTTTTTTIPTTTRTFPPTPTPSRTQPPTTTNGCVPTWVTYIDRNSHYGAVQSGVTTVSACRAACVADPRCVGVDWNPAGPPYCYAHRDRLNGPFRTVGVTQHVLVDRCTTDILGTLVGAQDPCNANLLMEDLDGGRRSPSFTTDFNTANMCDYLLDENHWYRFTSADSDRIPETCVEPNHCGTQWPIWLNGAHPTAAAPGPIDIEACASDLNQDCCGVFRETIQAKFCPGSNGGDDYYVYRLKNVPVCDMAYCAEGGSNSNNDTGTSFPEMTDDPIFIGPIEEVKNSRYCVNGTYTDFRFECRVRYPRQFVDDGARFNVSLTFNGKRDLSNPNTSVVTNGTALIVTFPSVALRGNVGKNVSCDVYSYWDSDAVASDVRRSGTSYWVGIRYTSPDYNPATGRVELLGDKTVDISMESTVPLAFQACNELDFLYNHAMTGVSTRDCQVYFKESRLEHTISLRVMPTPGCNSYSSLMEFKPYKKPGPISMWTNYVPDNITIFVRCTDVPMRMCKSYADPVIVTFDKKIYTTRTGAGDFLLVRSQFSDRLFEVHVRHEECISSINTCDCAVAVREGNDILVIQACYNGTIIAIRCLRDPNTPDGKANITQTGGSYKITMPSGAYVTARPYTLSGNRPGTYLNINVHPLKVDAYQTTGLCGDYNLDSGNDGPADPASNAYRLQRHESYINGHKYAPHCVHHGPMATVCRCEADVSVFNCTTDDTQTPVKILRTLNTDNCYSRSFSKRRKRDTEDEQEIIDDDIILPGDIPVPDYPDGNDNDIPVPEYYPDGNDTITDILLSYHILVVPSLPTWPTPSGITEQQARDACQRTLESYAAYNICREYVDLEQLIAMCALNVQLMDVITESLDGIVDELKENCIFGIESTLNTSSDDPRHQEDFVDRIFQEVKAVSCPGEPIACTGHGTCNNGSCTCDRDYVGRDCSLAANAVPDISSFRRGCACDARRFRCSKVSVAASNFYKSDRLTCKIQSAYWVNRRYPVYTYPAEVLSDWELECPLPPMTPNATSGAAVYTWNIRVSNDGQRYSNRLQMTVYDSDCMDCECGEQCQPKSGKCLINTQCYDADDVNPADASKSCEPNVSSTSWTRGV